MTMTLHDAKIHFIRCLTAEEAGDELFIARGKLPNVRLEYLLCSIRPKTGEMMHKTLAIPVGAFASLGEQERAWWRIVNLLLETRRLLWLPMSSDRLSAVFRTQINAWCRRFSSTAGLLGVALKNSVRRQLLAAARRESLFSRRLLFQIELQPVVDVVFLLTRGAAAWSGACLSSGCLSLERTTVASLSQSRQSTIQPQSSARLVTRLSISKIFLL